MADLHHAEVVADVAPPARDDAAAVVQLGEETLDSTAALGAPQRPTIVVFSR